MALADVVTMPERAATSLLELVPDEFLRRVILCLGVPGIVERQLYKTLYAEWEPPQARLRCKPDTSLRFKSNCS